VSSIDEKRVYGTRAGRTDLYLACDLGLARVGVSGGQVGEVALVDREPARDVATDDDRLVVAGEDVRLGAVAGDDRESRLEPTGFGPAAAVAADAAAVVAAGVDEGGGAAVARRAAGRWTRIGAVPAVSGLTPRFAATVGGVYAIGEQDGDRAGNGDGDGSPDSLGRVLDAEARDVVDGLAATVDGLYDVSGSEPRRLLEEPVAVVAAGPDGRPGALAVTDGGRLHERDADGWTGVDYPGAAPVAACRADGPALVTADGTVAIRADENGDGEWRTRMLGLPDVRAVAVG